jgi:hypothetical protein
MMSELLWQPREFLTDSLDALTTGNPIIYRIHDNKQKAAQISVLAISANLSAVGSILYFHPRMFFASIWVMSLDIETKDFHILTIFRIKVLSKKTLANTLKANSHFVSNKK